jgi:hypothetical protein
MSKKTEKIDTKRLSLKMVCPDIVNLNSIVDQIVKKELDKNDVKALSAEINSVNKDKRTVYHDRYTLIPVLAMTFSVVIILKEIVSGEFSAVALAMVLFLFKLFKYLHKNH